MTEKDVTSSDGSPWADFSLGFTYLSPVVGTYTAFGIALVGVRRPELSRTS